MTKPHYTYLLVSLLLLSACGIGVGSGPEPAVPTPESSTPTPSPTPSPTPEDLSSDSAEVQRLFWGSGNKQFGDLYKPQGVSALLPVIVMIHGGCWQSAYTLGLQAGLSEALAKRGYAVWNIEYRSLGNGGEWPAMFLDVAAATDYLSNIANDYSLDTNSIVTMGHSAGGHLALWLAGRAKLPESSILFNAQALPISGVVTLGGIADLQAGACGSLSRAIINANQLDAEQLDARLTETSPLHMLPLNVSSVLISGERDSIVPPAISQNYADAANLAGDPSEHQVLPGADHFYLIDEQRIDISLLESKVRKMLD